jgi:phosphoglycerate dehydrogenase-like enzyme
LNQAVADADYVVACLPDTPLSRGLICARTFAVMSPGCIFFNVGRAATVDHDALSDALRAGQIRAAIIDLTPTEPLPSTDPLWLVENLTITPHVAAVSYPRDVIEYFVANLERFRTDVPLEGVIDLNLGY